MAYDCAFTLALYCHLCPVSLPCAQVFPPGNNSTDLAISFIDWAPPPPDANMGLWRDVVYTAIPDTAPPVIVRNAVVQSVLSPSRDTAYLSIGLEVINLGDAVNGGVAVHLSLFPVPDERIEMPLAMNAQSSQFVVLSNSTYGELAISNPELWWPVRMGRQTLHNLTAYYDAPSTTPFPYSCRFGIRQVDGLLDTNGNRLFKVNGVPIIPLGGGWASDLFLRNSRERQIAEFNYVVHMGLNAIRVRACSDNMNRFA